MGGATALAQTDSLVLDNGDIIVGEIKIMEKNVLTLETDYSDTYFKIEWNKVHKVYSDQIYLITLSDGTRLNASIKTDLDSVRNVILKGEIVELRSEISHIVYIKPIEEEFISRWNAALDLGYNSTCNKNLQQFSARTSVGYLDKFWSFNGSFDAVHSSQDSAENIRRTDANITFRYFLKKDWFVLLSEDFLQNDEQKL